MKKWIILGVAGVLLIGLLVLGITMFSEYSGTGQGTGESVTVEIEQGDGIRGIAAKLKSAGLIKYESVFYLKVKSMGVGGSLRYGTFTFAKGTGLQNIIEGLTKDGAKKEEGMFTVPEGYTIELIAKKLEKEGYCSEADFLEAVEEDYDYWFLEEVPYEPELGYRLQGFLFPETYAVAEDMTAQDIVKVMLDQFDKQFTEEMKGQMKAARKTAFQIVTEASIIERETKIDSEREIVAGVIQNRLRQGMKLQMCPTVLYPLTQGIYDKTTVSYADTQVESPYNTYLHSGLPIGPIANPGILSLKAALNPAEHEYLFYHTDTKKNDGSHIFTKTYQEHTNTQ